MPANTTSGPQHGVLMPAVDLRQYVGLLLSAEGVRDDTDYAVSQRASGANMSVDVAAGEAYIQDDHAAGGGMYHKVRTTTENLTITAAHASLPRVDRIIILINDQFLGDADNTNATKVLAGTPTSGADLSNLNGAASVPNNAILLANVLVPAAASSIVDANIDTTLRSVRPKMSMTATGFVLIQDILRATDGAIDFQNISAAFTHLQVVAHLRGDTAADSDSVGIRFNNDSASNYRYAYHGNVGNADSFASSDSTTSIQMGLVPGASADANNFGTVRFTVVNYLRTQTYRDAMGETFGSTTSSARHYNAGGQWKNTAAAINRITLVGPTNWKTNSRATLYGLV